METDTPLNDDPVNRNIVTLPLNVTISSHQYVLKEDNLVVLVLFLCRQCSACRQYLKSSSCTISEEDRELLFIKSNIFLREGSRCCKDHIRDKRLRIDAFHKIRPFKIANIDFSSTDVIAWFNKFRAHYNCIQYFDSNVPFVMSDIDCYNLTGLWKSNCERLIEFLAESNIKSSFKVPPQKSIFVQESPNELKFIGYVGGIM